MEDPEKSKNYEMTTNTNKCKDLRYFVKESIFFDDIIALGENYGKINPIFN